MQRRPPVLVRLIRVGDELQELLGTVVMSIHCSLLTFRGLSPNRNTNEEKNTKDRAATERVDAAE